METIVEFKNRHSLTLRGVLHLPGSESKDIGVVFVHSGVQGRHGNTNQYVFYAREFCKLGYTCLRFDPYGLGDSEGLIEPMNMRDYYGSIQTGRYVEDTLDAVSYFNNSGIKKVVLFGLCGGAITSLLSGAFIKDLSGLILLSCPTMLDSSEIDYNLRIPKEIAVTYLKGYVRKLFKLKYWVRLISFKSNYKEIYAYIKTGLFKNDSKNQNNSESTKKVKVNRYFLKSYKTCSQNFPIHWIFGDNDTFWFEFKNEFYDKGFMDDQDKLTLLHDANHMFTIHEWQKKTLSSASEWLKGLSC